MRIIDCHCHVYPGKVADRAVSAIGGFYGIPMRYDGTTDTLLKKGGEAGVTDYLIHSVATTPMQVRSANEFLMAEVESHDGKFMGFGTLHPDSEDPEGDVEHLIGLGLKGVKIHPDFIKRRVDDPGFMRMFEIIEGRLPICIHTGDYRYDNSNPNRMKRVLKAFPGLLVIGAHYGGWSIWEQASDELHGFDNLIVDCSSSLAFITSEKATEITRLYGSERVLFGSDYPMWTPADELERLRKLSLTQQELENILYKNAERLLGF